MSIRHLFQRPAASGVVVARTPPELRPAALSAATGQSVAEASQFERRAAQRGMDTNLLWSAHTPDGRVLAAVLAVPSAGRTASILASTCPDPSAAATVGEILRKAAHELEEAGNLALLQSLPRPEETNRARALEQGGFRRLALLEYMERPNRPPQTPKPQLADSWRLDPWHPSQSELLIALLQQTFEGTLDCPGLASMRTGRDILDGHLHSGDQETGLWRILRRDGVPVGTVLASPCAATNSVDIVYLGLVPSARGMGMGTALLWHALHLAAQKRERTVQVAVDVANAPAARLYRTAGFIARSRREAWVRPLSSGGSCPHRMDT